MEEALSEHESLRPVDSVSGEPSTGRGNKGILPKRCVESGPRIFPRVKVRLKAVLRAPSLTPEDLTKALLADPALTAHMLKMVSAPHRRRGDGFTNVSDAVSWLGVVPVTKFLTKLCEGPGFEDIGGFGKTMRDHSLEVAALARRLSEFNGESKVEEIYIAALLHDLGILLCIQDRPNDYATLEPHFGDHHRLHMHERQLFGFDHGKLGWHAANTWELPAPLSTVLAWHHQGSRAYALGGEVADYVAYVRASEELLDALDEHDELEQGVARHLAKSPALTRLKLSANSLLGEWGQLQRCLSEARESFARG